MKNTCWQKKKDEIKNELLAKVYRSSNTDTFASFSELIYVLLNVGNIIDLTEIIVE